MLLAEFAFSLGQDGGEHDQSQDHPKHHDHHVGFPSERLMSALLEHRGLSDEEADRIQAMIDTARGKKGAEKRGES